MEYEYEQKKKFGVKNQRTEWMKFKRTENNEIKNKCNQAQSQMDDGIDWQIFNNAILIRFEDEFKPFTHMIWQQQQLCTGCLKHR